MFKWVYVVATGEFLSGGPCDVTPSSGQAVAVLKGNPKPRLERYDGANGIRKATAQEIIAYDAAQNSEREQGRFNEEKMLKALAMWTAGKLNVPVNTAKQEILAIYRGLS